MQDNTPPPGFTVWDDPIKKDEWDLEPVLEVPNRADQRAAKRRTRFPGAPRGWMPWQMVRIYYQDRTPKGRARTGKRWNA
ncbi:MAG: hypothetical protein V3U14_12915 [candidate division NC10 bacterium]